MGEMKIISSTPSLF
jgi:hypothetical protein